MTYRIFLVEDDRSIAEGLQHQLEQWNFEVRVVQNFRGVLGEFTAFDPHLVLMDIMLPCYDGYHWCREIRRVSEVPIIFLSSASDNMNLIMAMNMGGDDFIPKPFDWNVLLAKIQALLRRTYDFGGQVSLLEHRDAILNTADAVLTYHGERIDLTKNEYRILQALMEQKGKVVSRETLMERLWATDSFVDENTLTVNVNRLRKKLDKGRAARLYPHQSRHGIPGRIGAVTHENIPEFFQAASERHSCICAVQHCVCFDFLPV